MSSKQPRVVPPKQAPPGARVGPSPSSTEGQVPDADLIKALQLLQGVVASEDFSKNEKLVTTTKKEDKVKNIVSSSREKGAISRQAAEAGGWSC